LKSIRHSDLKKKRNFLGNRTQVTHTAGKNATTVLLQITYSIVLLQCLKRKSVKVKNKTTYYEETGECHNLIFWPGSWRRSHCHIAKLEPNWRLTIDHFPLSVREIHLQMNLWQSDKPIKTFQTCNVLFLQMYELFNSWCNRTM
jgi:hypothetical protein